MGSSSSRVVFRLVDTVISVAIWISAVVLLYAGIAKMAAIPAFAATLQHHGIVPETIVHPVAFGVAGAEVGIGGTTLWCLLLQSRATPVAVAGFALIYACFAVYGYLVLVEGDSKSSCGCGLPRFMLEDWGRPVWRSSVASLALIGASIRCGHVISRVRQGDGASVRSAQA